jgi:hypothetical protein
MQMNVKRKKITRMLVLAALFFGCAGFAQAQDDVIVLDSLSHLYDGAVFDHTMHLDMVPECAACHHHTTGTPAIDEKCVKCHSSGQAIVSSGAVACRDCHQAQPFSAENIRVRTASLNLYHLDKPGLKAAYHVSCLGCHQAMGAPTGCNDCHLRNEVGEAFFHSGVGK